MNTHRAKQTIRTPGYKRTAITNSVRNITPAKPPYTLQGVTVVAGQQVTVATISGKFWIIITN